MDAKHHFFSCNRVNEIARRHMRVEQRDRNLLIII